MAFPQCERDTTRKAMADGAEIFIPSLFQRPQNADFLSYGLRPFCLFFARTQVTHHVSIGRSRVQRDERDSCSYQITQAICWMLQTNDVAFEAFGRRRKPKLSPVVRRPLSRDHLESFGRSGRTYHAAYAKPTPRTDNRVSQATSFASSQFRLAKEPRVPKERSTARAARIKNM